MNVRLLRTGFLIWLGATLALRLFGQYVLRPGDWRGTTVLFLVTFPSMAWLGRRLCARPGLSRGEQMAGVASLILPTLLLDSFSSALFAFAYPNISAQAAGVFGGWMLWCCAAAIVGVLVGQRNRDGGVEQR